MIEADLTGSTKGQVFSMLKETIFFLCSTAFHCIKNVEEYNPMFEIYLCKNCTIL